MSGQELDLEVTLKVQGGSLIVTLPKHTSYSTPEEMNSRAVKTRPRKVKRASSELKNSYHFYTVNFGSDGIVFRASVGICNAALATLQFQPEVRTHTRLWFPSC